MNITVAGTGYVGLPLAAAFASMGNRVFCLDNNSQKIENLKKGILPISEPGLEALVQDGVKHKLLKFSTSYEEVLKKCEIIFIAVGTPPGEDGSADLQFVKAVAKTIGQKITAPIIVADKSTVPVGTADLVRDIIQEELDKRKVKIDFWVVSNPEFMAEGRAVKDVLEPNRVVVGSNSEKVSEKMKSLYAPFMRKTDRFYGMSIKAAELTKYASNTMLALRISFINTIAALCDVIFTDVSEISKGMGSDPRIGPSFLYASLGYGGSCFPKDVKALIAFAKKMNLPAPYLKLLEAIEDVNNFQKTVISRKVISRFGNDLLGKKFAIWGLSFKAKTNDMRESAAINAVEILIEHGAKIVAYDPLAVSEAKEIYLKKFEDKIKYEEVDKYSILEGCEALIIATETQEYREIDVEILKKTLKNPIIFDGRNLFSIEAMKETGIEYYAIGRGEEIDWQSVKL